MRCTQGTPGHLAAPRSTSKHPEAPRSTPIRVTFFRSRLEEFQTLTRDDPSAFAPPPAFGPFRVLHQVGVGALGPVFRTYEPTRDRLVAVKVFRLDITPEQAGALADELSKSAEAGLFHPSIIEPIAAGVEGSVAYRADEYVAAETLDVAMRHYAPAPVEKVMPFIAQLAGAIDFARSAGVGHGALHPRDIFVTPEEARAGGFGVVDALERVGIRAPVRRPYTAPERVAGGTWGVTADVFSLGVIAYELLTGRRPSGMGDRIGTITGGPHQAAIHGVLARAVAEDPSRRYPTALTFAAALDAAARGEAPAAIEGPVAHQPSTAFVAPLPVDEGAALAGMPPPPDIDEREEPVEAEQEEEAFRASAPYSAEVLDDVAAEGDEAAQAYVLPTPRELEREREDGDARLAAAADRSLFEEEGIQDLALEPDQVRGTERFADEFVAAADASAREAVVASTSYTAPRHASLIEREPEEPVPYDDEPVIVPERRGFGFVPVALTVLLALLVAFAAGYAVRGRMPVDVTDGASGDPASSDPSTAGSPAGQPYSEQDVAPPTATGPPPPSGEQVPPADRADAPAGRVAEPPAAPAPEPAAPVATTGRVQVRSTPAGAAVTLDGKWMGRTPMTLDDLRLGDHVVRVVQPGYETAREEVTLSTSSPSRELSFRLRRTAPAPRANPQRQAAPKEPAKPVSYTGSVYVDSRPRGARVLLNGKFVGTTPVRIPDVPIGSQIVRLELANHRFWTTSTRVSSGQESRVTGSLEPIR